MINDGGAEFQTERYGHEGWRMLLRAREARAQFRLWTIAFLFVLFGMIATGYFTARESIQAESARRNQLQESLLAESAGRRLPELDWINT